MLSVAQSANVKNQKKYGYESYTSNGGGPMSWFAQTSRNIGLAAGLLFCSGVIAAPAMAATITYNFYGSVTDVGRFLSPPAVPSPQFTTESPLTGTMTVNTADGNLGSSTFGGYSIQSLSVTIGGYTATVGPTGTVNIRNGNGGGAAVDRFEVSAPSQPGILVGDPINFLLPRLFTINLRGDKNAFTSDELPSSVPSLNSFANLNRFRLQFGPTNGANARVQGELTSLTAVPLPTSVILFGLGLVALIGLGAGGLRNIRVPQA
jgi:hypothetical protein